LAVVDFFVLLVAVFFSATANPFLDADQGAGRVAEGAVTEALLRNGSTGHARHRSVARGMG
jgi:hypothetical protein